MIFIHIIFEEKTNTTTSYPVFKQNKHKNLFLYSGTKIWNQIGLPKEIKELNLPKFKKELKRLYLFQYANNK